VLSTLALASIPLLSLGPPFVLAGAGFVLGLVGRTGGHRGRATVAVAAGGAVVFVGAVAYTAVAIQKLVWRAGYASLTATCLIRVYSSIEYSDMSLP
jgi:hypothetical protein